MEGGSTTTTTVGIEAGAIKGSTTTTVGPKASAMEGGTTNTAVGTQAAGAEEGSLHDLIRLLSSFNYYAIIVSIKQFEIMS